MPQAPAAPDIFDDVAGGSSSSGDIFDQVSGEAPKTYLPEVNQAVAAVPKPALPRELQPTKPLPPLDLQKAIVGGVTDIFTGGGMPANEFNARPLGEPMAQGVRELETPGKRGTGALRVAATGTEALTPLMGPAALENPASIARGLAEGTAASEGGGYLLKKAGVSDENVQNAKSLLFWAPGVARSVIDPKLAAEVSPEGTRVSGTVAGGRVGAGVAVTPEGVTVRGKVGPFEGSKTFGRGPAAGPAIEPPTIEAQPGPPVSDDPAITSMVASKEAEVAAAKQAAGIPPPPQPAPPRIIDHPNAPPELQNGHLPQKLVDNFASVVTALPENVRAQAIQEAHQTLAQVLLEGSQKGPMVGPDGKLLQVKDAADANKQAMALINDAISAHEKVLAKASGEAKGGKAGAEPTPPGTASAITAGRAARQQAEDIFDQVASSGATGNAVEASTPQGRSEATETAKPSQEANAAPQGTVREGHRPTPAGNEVEPKPESTPAVSKAGAPEAQGNAPEKPALKKGDKATLAKETVVGNKTLPAGTPVSIQYVHPNNLLVRATTADGIKISRGTSAFTKEVPMPRFSPEERAMMDTALRASSPSQQLKDRVKASPNEKVVGPDTQGQKNMYVPLVRDRQRIGSGWMGEREDLGAGVAEVHRADIRPEHQGKGNAKELYATLFAEAKKEGFKRLLSDSVQSPEARRAWDGMVRRGLAKEITDAYGEKRYEYTGGQPNESKAAQAPSPVVEKSEPKEVAVPENRQAGAVATEEAAKPTYSLGNPFAERALAARAKADRLNKPTAHDAAMEKSFPLGGGFGRPGASKRIDASVNRAVEAVEATKNADYLEAQAKAYDRGEINAQGRSITPESQARSIAREEYQDKRNARVDAARAQLEGKERWQVPAEVYADSTNNLGGGARKLVLADHREYVEKALAEGKPVPAEVLKDYPDLQPKIERRSNLAERKRVSEMSHEERGKELLASHVVDLPNRRAFDEAEHQPAKAVAMSDADGLKALNDKFGYEAGNELLRAKAEALKQAGLDAYHEKGDEFLYRGASKEELESKLDKAREILRNRTIEVQMKDGSVRKFKGADFSHGTGSDLAQAEAGLKSHKSEREARGERARGELRGITEVGSAKSEVSKSPAAEVAEPEHPNLQLGEHAEHTEMVPVEALDRFKEFDRRQEPRGEDAYLDELKADIKRTGIKQPLVLKYGVNDKKISLDDGNHRLQAAQELGIREVPARVKIGLKTDADLGKPVAGYKGEFPVPENLRPSQVGIEGRAVGRNVAERPPVSANVAEKGTVEPGKVGEMKVADLRVAPNRFQYKIGTDAQGTSTLLKEAKTFNPDLAGTISVWRDPADGKFYVVNGHHRYELAKRTGQKEVAVRHIVAKDAAEARAVGARQNIAEGRGTPVDAAKFFRDTSITPEDLEKHGISLGEATAAKGLALSNLDDALFRKVVNGELREGRAVAIGEATKDPAEQKAILALVERKERVGSKVSDDTLSELIRLVKGSEQTTETTANLFGSQQITRSLALEKAEISAHIKQQLAKDKKLFGFVAKEGRATELARAGNKIDVEKSKEISTGAAQAEEVYNRLSERGGPIASILDNAARQLADGENASTVKADAYTRVRAEVSETLRGSEREVSGRLEAGAGPESFTEARVTAPVGADLKRPKANTEEEPTLPGMENVPAERAAAVAEKQGEDLTAQLVAPPKSIESKAGEIEQKSPLFRDTEANPQKEMFDGLFSDESGSLEPGKVAEAATAFFDQDVAPALKKSGMGIRDVAAVALRAIYPRIEESNPVGRALGIAAPADAVDALMKVQGDRAKALSEFDLVLNGVAKMFDRLPEEARIDFIDKIQTGKKQSAPELQDLAEMFKKIMDGQREAEEDAMNLGRPQEISANAKAPIELSRKENYFHNWWEERPGKEPEEKEDERISRLFMPRRPLEGTKGYNKRQSYTLKSGIEAGGKPVTTNPVRILRHRIEDGMKFVTARRAWNELNELGLRAFVQKGDRPVAGFDKIDDRIAKVYFPAESGEGNIQAGEWYVEANTARLLNNMLSVDKIRANAAGRALLTLKNMSTALELGLSPFHAVFETIEAASSMLSLGLSRAYNLGIRKGSLSELAQGVKEMASSPIAPITLAREGAAIPAYIEARARLGKIGLTEFGHAISGDQPHGIIEAIKQFQEVRKERAVQRLIKQYPDLDQLIDDMFQGGLVVGQHRDYQVKAFGKTAAEAWTEGNPIGAVLRSVPTVLQGTMYPLFNWYIPSLKYSLFFKMMSEQAAEHSAELEDGSLTRATLARQVADSTENRFGELNIDNLFLNRTVKSALQFVFRSVTYKLGTAREFLGGGGAQMRELSNWARDGFKALGGGGGGEERPPSNGATAAEEPERNKRFGEKALPRLDMRASWVASLMLTTAIIGTIAAKLLSGKYPWEWVKEDKNDAGGDLRHLQLEMTHPRTGEVDSRGKPVRASLPTYFKDVEHAASNPAQYVLSSLSGTLSKGMDIAENRDYFNNYVFNPTASLGTKAKQIGKYAFPTPFVVSNFQRGQQQGQGKTAWLSAFGFPKAPSDLDFTPAEKLARDIIKSHEHPETPEELEAWREKYDAFRNGKLPLSQAKAFAKRARETMLQRQLKNSEVSYSDARRIYQAANADERRSLDRIMHEKRARLMREGRGSEVKTAEAQRVQ